MLTRLCGVQAARSSVVGAIVLIELQNGPEDLVQRLQVIRPAILARIVYVYSSTRLCAFNCFDQLLVCGLQDRLAVYDAGAVLQQARPLLAAEIDHGASVFTLEPSDVDVVDCAIRGDVKAIQALTSKPGFFVDTPDKVGPLTSQCPRPLAMGLSHCLVPPLFSRARAQSGMTALMVACNLMNTRTAVALLELHANPNAKTLAGWTPMLYAVSKGCAALVPTLLQAGADVNIASKVRCCVAVLSCMLCLTRARVYHHCRRA